MFGASAVRELELLRTVEGSGADDVLLYHARHKGVSSPAGVSDHHLLIVNVGRQVAARCRIGSAELDHACEVGNITMIPAAMPWSAELDAGMEQVVIAIPAPRIAVAAVRSESRSARVEARLNGHIPALASIVGEMARAAPGPDEAAWHFLADELADEIVGLHAPEDRRQSRGGLSEERLKRLNDYLATRLADTVSIDALADVAGEGRVNFPRAFRRSVGMSPHQYVIRLRLLRARLLIADGVSLAEASADAGFSHQSHLTNWMRRIYGVTPGSLARRSRTTETCKTPGRRVS